MNERLQELAEQATTYIEPTATSGEGWIFDKEKFALLIIEECAKLAEYQGYNQAFGLGGLRTKLHEHFGVNYEKRMAGV
jgi:hypothetical protein